MGCIELCVHTAQRPTPTQIRIGVCSFETCPRTEPNKLDILVSVSGSNKCVFKCFFRDSNLVFSFFRSAKLYELKFLGRLKFLQKATRFTV